MRDEQKVDCSREERFVSYMVKQLVCREEASREGGKEMRWAIRTRTYLACPCWAHDHYAVLAHVGQYGCRFSWKSAWGFDGLLFDRDGLEFGFAPGIFYGYKIT